MDSTFSFEAPFGSEDNDPQGQRFTPLPTPLAGPGSSRRNQKLQLRKRGFRGGAVTGRNITPNRATTSAWSPMNAEAADTEDGDADNHQQHSLPPTRKSSSILQEVSNSSLRRKGKKTPKRETLVSVFQDENAEVAGSPWQRESSPAWYVSKC